MNSLGRRRLTAVQHTCRSVLISLALKFLLNNLSVELDINGEEESMFLRTFLPFLSVHFNTNVCSLNKMEILLKILKIIIWD